MRTQATARMEQEKFFQIRLLILIFKDYLADQGQIQNSCNVFYFYIFV